MNEWKELVYIGIGLLLASFVITMASQMSTVSRGLMRESSKYAATQATIAEYRKFSAFDDKNIGVPDIEYLVNSTQGNTGVFIFDTKSDYDKFRQANDKKLTKKPNQVALTGDYLYYCKAFVSRDYPYEMDLVDSDLMDMCGGPAIYLNREFYSSVMYDDGGGIVYVACYLVP